MKIIFFGSTDFSLPIVKKLHGEFELMSVVATKPKPKGRGLKTAIPETVRWAQIENINVFMPDDPNDEMFIKNISKLKPDIFVLSAYGYILSDAILKIPRLGGINIHPSLLPRYRGAAPIQRAIMAGERKTGVTIFFMDEKIDHGDIVFQKETTIEPDDTYGSLSGRLSLLSADVIVDVLRSIELDNYIRVKQQQQYTSYAPKLKKEELLINWQDEAQPIYNLIRGLSPKPGAKAIFRGRELIILETRPSGKKLNPGSLHIEDKKLYVGTGSNSLILEQLKPEGKSVISGLDFINGYRIKEGETFK